MKIALLMIIVIAGSFLELLAVSVFSPFIDLIMDMDSLEESDMMSFLYRMFDFKDLTHFLAFLATGIIVIYIVKNVYIIAEKNIIYIRWWY